MNGQKMEREFCVVELVTIEGGHRVLAHRTSWKDEDDAIETAEDLAAEADERKEDRYFAVVPVRWIKQC